MHSTGGCGTASFHTCRTLTTTDTHPPYTNIHKQCLQAQLGLRLLLGWAAAHACCSMTRCIMHNVMVSGKHKTQHIATACPDNTMGNTTAGSRKLEAPNAPTETLLPHGKGQCNSAVGSLITLCDAPSMVLSDSTPYATILISLFDPQLGAILPTSSTQYLTQQQSRSLHT